MRTAATSGAGAVIQPTFQPAQIAPAGSAERLAPELDVVAASVNGVDAWDDCLAFEPQLCFLDIRMPGLSGIDVARRIGTLIERAKANGVSLDMQGAVAVVRLCRPTKRNALNDQMIKLLREAFPGGYQGTMKKPEDVVQAFLDLASANCTKNGEVIKA